MKKLLTFIFLLLMIVACDTNESKLRKTTGISLEQEEEINKILLESGFGNDIVKIEYDELLDGSYSEGGKGYRADFRLEGNSGVTNVTLYFTKDNLLEKIRYNTKNFYTDKKVIDNVKNYLILPSEENEYIRYCTHNIKSLLKSPATAKFPNITQWKMGKKEGKVVIQSYVDAQNSFGAMIRSNFQFIIDLKTNTVISLIFDGKEYIKNKK